MPAQRDIVEVFFDEEFGGNHPAVIISNNLVQEIEGYFVCIMMTSKNHDDEFSFVITDDMVNSHRNQLRIEPFKDLISKINQSTFSTEKL